MTSSMSYLKHIPKIAFAALYLLAIDSSLAQTLLGSTVTVKIDYPTFGATKNNPPSKTVSDGIEFLAGSLQPLPGWVIGPVNIDIKSTSVEFTWSGSGQSSSTSFDGVQLLFNTQSPIIIGASISPSSSFSAAQLPVGYTDHSVWVNFAGGLQITPAKFVQLDLQLAPVPEPTTWMLLASGICIISTFAARRRDA